MNCGEIWPPCKNHVTWTRSWSASSSATNSSSSFIGGFEKDDHVIQSHAGSRGHERVDILSGGSETEEPRNDRSLQGNAPPPTAVLTHRLRHNKSILVVIISETHIYAGTQAGEILVFTLDTYGRIAAIQGHKASVLGLAFSEDGALLFSSAGDRLVNVWDTKTFQRKFYIFSTYDVGDVFCVAFSTKLETFYVGLQNTAIQWHSLRSGGNREKPTLKDHPLWRADHPFYDSPGPGGIRTPRPADEEIGARDARGGQALTIPEENIHHFAHYGYVYCMLLATDTFSGGPPDQVLITGGGDGIINVWGLGKTDAGAPFKLFDLHDDRDEGQSILSICVEGTFLYAGRSQGEVNVWDLETRQLVRSLRSHRDDVMSVCVLGGVLFSASVTGFVRKYDRQYQNSSRTLAHEGKALTAALVARKDKSLYITGGNDNTIAVWDISDCIARPNDNSKTTNEQMIECLRRFVSYKTVSSDIRFKGDCRRGASYLRSVFKGFGAVTEMLPTDDANNPIILARFRGNPTTAANRKKVLFYGHYDVVAADNDSGKWTQDPFTMQGINGFVYGRGVSDNKGPIVAAIYACAELMTKQALGADIVFLIEGEEECGSRGFARAIRRHKKAIGDIDWILLANSYWLDDSIPCLTYGLRGVIHASIQVESDHPDLHSGVDGSAKLDESLKDLITLLSKLSGKHGHVELPGFYDPIPGLTKHEETLYKDITDALISRNPSLPDSDELAASLMRRWRDPSLTIHRFQTSGPDNATIIPKSAKAALSIRLVPNQTADEIGRTLVDYLHAQFSKLESNNKLTVTIDHQAEPWLGDVNNEIFKTLEEAVMDVWGTTADIEKASSGNLPPLKIPTETDQSYFSNKPSPTTSNALASASTTSPGTVSSPGSRRGTDADSESQGHLARSIMRKNNVKSQAGLSNGSRDKEVTRRKPLYIREGGSIPAIRFLELEFDAPAAHLPCGQASDSAHLDNERLRLVNLYKSKEIFAKVFRDLPCR